jgi:hypothetical protein
MGLLDNALQALKSQYQETKGNVGLLMSDPKRYMSGLNQDAAEYNRLSSLALQAERNAYRGLPVSAEQTAAKQYIDQQQQDMALGFAGNIKPVKSTGLAGTPYERSLQQGYEHDWYHGTTGDVKEFRPDLLGEATGAASAKQGFFFARDPIAPPAELSKKSANLNPNIVAALKAKGKTQADIDAMNTISMKGHGADQASGYAQLGGDREYKEAMRMANIAEKKGNWDEYEKQMAIAEDFAIKKQQNAQSLVAKYGDARDVMTSKLQNLYFGKNIPKDPGEAYDKLSGVLPYGWEGDPKKLEQIKQTLIGKFGQKEASDAIKAIDQFKATRAERVALDAQSGANVIPAALRYKNPMVYDFKGNAYREQSYNDLVSEAKAKGHDALILRNTYDPGAGTAKLIDVGVVFDPGQIRSRFAQFDPAKVGKPDLVAGVVPLGLLGQDQLELKKEKKPKK